MPTRATVTINGSLTLVADVGLYEPFVFPADRVFTGPGSLTVQDFGRKIKRASGRLRSGGNQSPGLISRATLASLLGLIGTRGATYALTDSLGNVGTVKLTDFTHQHETGVPGSQVALFSWALAWRWLTLTQRYGSAYSE